MRDKCARTRKQTHTHTNTTQHALAGRAKRDWKTQKLLMHQSSTHSGPLFEIDFINFKHSLKTRYEENKKILLKTNKPPKRDLLCVSAWRFVCCSCFLVLPAVAAAALIISRRPSCLLDTISMCTHILWPRLKFMKSPPSSRGGLQQGPAKSAMSSLLRSDCCSRFQSYQQLSIGDVLDAVHPSQAAVIRRQNKQPAAKRRSPESRQVGPNIRVMEEGGGIKEKKKIKKNNRDVVFSVA